MLLLLRPHHLLSLFGTLLFLSLLAQPTEVLIKPNPFVDFVKRETRSDRGPLKFHLPFAKRHPNGPLRFYIHTVEHVDFLGAQQGLQMVPILSGIQRLIQLIGNGNALLISTF